MQGVIQELSCDSTTEGLMERAFSRPSCHTLIASLVIEKLVPG